MSWEQIQMLTRVFMAGSCVLLVMGDAKTIEYPPVLEGSTVTLSCKGNTTSEDRIVSWNQYDKSEKRFKPPIFSFGQNRTSYNHEQGYNATIINTGDTFNSNFTIENLSRQSHANERFVCIVVDKSINYSFIVASWNFSSIVRNPSIVKCSASVSLLNSLNVTCFVVDIFPNVFCEFYELSDQKMTLVGKWNDSSIKVLLHRRNSEGDLSATCSVARPVERSGKYNFRIKVLPDLRLLNNTNFNIREATAEVTFTPEGIILLEQVCSVPLVIRYRCTGWWIPKNLTVEWYEDDKLYLGSQESFLDEGGLFRLNSFYNVSNHKSEIYCKIRLPDLELKSKKVNSEINWQMSKEPFFVSNGVRLMGDQLGQENPNSKLECHVEAEPHRVQTLSINCTSKGTSVSVTASSSSKNTTWLSPRNLSESETLDMCYCSALFENNCVFSTQLRMLASSGVVVGWHSFSMTSLISFVVAACLLLVLIILIFATAGFLKSKWSSIYTYVYDTVHGKSSSEPRDVHNDLYHTVNSAHASSSSLGNSQEFHNITRVLSTLILEQDASSRQEQTYVNTWHTTHHRVDSHSTVKLSAQDSVTPPVPPSRSASMRQLNPGFPNARVTPGLSRQQARSLTRVQGQTYRDRNYCARRKLARGPPRALPCHRGSSSNPRRVPNISNSNENNSNENNSNEHIYLSLIPD